MEDTAILLEEITTLDPIWIGIDDVPLGFQQSAAAIRKLKILLGPALVVLDLAPFSNMRW